MKKLVMAFCFILKVSAVPQGLELPDGAPEILVTLSGTLHLQSCFEDDVVDCWFLKMDESSFEVASTTPVWGYPLSIEEILQRSDRLEVQLGEDPEMEEFFQNHMNQFVTVQGFLFHAHTGHHHAPFQMDLEKIDCKAGG